MEQFAAAVVGSIIIGLILLAGHWMYVRLSESIAARLSSHWRSLALPVTAVLCGGAFAVLRPLVVDQPTTPLWFVLGAAAIAMLFASATAFALALVQGGRKPVELSWRPLDPEDDDR